MSINLPLHVELDDEVLRRQVQSHIQTSITKILTAQFCDGKNGSKGISYEALEEFTSSLISSDASITLVEKLIEEHWTRLLTEATLKALEHKANRVAFSRIKSARFELEKSNEQSH